MLPRIKLVATNEVKVRLKRRLRETCSSGDNVLAALSVSPSFEDVVRDTRHVEIRFACSKLQLQRLKLPTLEETVCWNETVGAIMREHTSNDIIDNMVVDLPPPLLSL